MPRPVRFSTSGPPASKPPASLAFVSPDLVSYKRNSVQSFRFLRFIKARPVRHFAATAARQRRNDGRLRRLPHRYALAGRPRVVSAASSLPFRAIPAWIRLKAVYYVGIRNKQDTLKLLRYTFGEKLGSERSEGETTFVKVSLGGSQKQHRSRAMEFLSPRHNTELRSRLQPQRNHP